jgi:D-alanyl-D-alanine dipeptidase
MQLDRFVNLSKFSQVVIQLKYASIDNFMGKNVYGKFTEAYLHAEAAKKFERAIAILQKESPGWKFVVFDALRPRSAQWSLWNHVRGTPEEIYVANPERGGMHNFGCAIDLSLLDAQGRTVDMGTGFDAFVPLSQPQLEQTFLARGQLTQTQIQNRLILREAMTQGGFIQLPHEWWHFDAFPADEVRARFEIVE